MNKERLNKVEEQFKKDLADIFREIAQDRFRGLLLSVSSVSIAPDLSLARVYISIFPATEKKVIVDWLNSQEGSIKNKLVQKLRGGLRKMPELIFYLDDSVEREAEIDRILKGGGESPIK